MFKAYQTHLPDQHVLSVPARVPVANAAGYCSAQIAEKRVMIEPPNAIRVALSDTRRTRRLCDAGAALSQAP